MSYSTPVQATPQMTGTIPHEAPAPIYSEPQVHHDAEKSAFGQHPQQQPQQQLQQYPSPGAYNNGVPPQSDPNFQQQQNFQQGPNVQQQQQQQQQPAAGQQTSQFQSAVPLASLQGTPAPVDCPLCGKREMTRTEFISGGTTHLSALLCCCCLCLGCIPYLASWFKDCEHHCGSCSGVLAVWHRSGRTEVVAHRRG